MSRRHITGDYTRDYVILSVFASHVDCVLAVSSICQTLILTASIYAQHTLQLALLAQVLLWYTCSESLPATASTAQAVLTATTQHYVQRLHIALFPLYLCQCTHKAALKHSNDICTSIKARNHAAALVVARATTTCTSKSNCPLQSLNKCQPTLCVAAVATNPAAAAVAGDT
eukprot:21028-Heterococcus_DN1.PRE.2